MLFSGFIWLSREFIKRLYVWIVVFLIKCYLVFILIIYFLVWSFLFWFLFVRLDLINKFWICFLDIWFSESELEESCFVIWSSLVIWGFDVRWKFLLWLECRCRLLFFLLNFNCISEILLMSVLRWCIWLYSNKKRLKLIYVFFKIWGILFLWRGRWVVGGLLIWL